MRKAAEELFPTISPASLYNPALKKNNEIVVYGYWENDFKEKILFLEKVFELRFCKLLTHKLFPCTNETGKGEAALGSLNKIGAIFLLCKVLL